MPPVTRLPLHPKPTRPSLMSLLFEAVVQYVRARLERDEPQMDRGANVIPIRR